MRKQYGAPTDHFAGMGCPSGHRRKPRLGYMEAKCEFIVESEPVNPFARCRVCLSKFQGCLQPEEFLDWVVIVEGALDVKEVFDEHLVSLVVNTFRGIVTTWWQQLKQTRL
jgi:hypothetical protein